MSRTVEFLVDSGAKYSLLPERVWREIGLVPRRRMGFVLADGSRIERDISECLIGLLDDYGHTPVILGEAASFGMGTYAVQMARGAITKSNYRSQGLRQLSLA